MLAGTQRQLLLRQLSEHRAKIAGLARQQAQKEAIMSHLGAQCGDAHNAQELLVGRSM